eukprot:m.121094 g.121094  ORF g.121094 m.121094 type:complete len:78 (+) comp37749_c0_seq7:563-796(+)
MEVMTDLFECCLFVYLCTCPLVLSFHATFLLKKLVKVRRFSLAATPVFHPKMKQFPSAINFLDFERFHPSWNIGKPG